MILSPQTQAWIIARLLDGKDAHFDPDDLTGFWHDCYQWIQKGTGDETPKERWTYFIEEFLILNKQHQVNHNLIWKAHKNPASYPPIDQRLDAPPTLSWLWPGWIPRGLLSLLVAEPGTGKSHLALDVAHRIAAGTEYPDGLPTGNPGNVLYVDAENTPQVLKKRLHDWNGAERRRLYLMLPDPGRMMLNLNDIEDRDRLMDTLFHIRPELAIIDSYATITLKSVSAPADQTQNLQPTTRNLAFPLTRFRVYYLTR